jgi:O-antigen ligase
MTAIVSFVIAADPDGYLSRQITSIVSPTEESSAVSQHDGGYLPQSLSNAQRLFAFQAGWDQFLSSPLIGVGTNQYVDLVNATFAYLPFYLRTGIHDEFFRVLVENGVLGFSVYIASWLMALFRLMKTTDLSRWASGLQGAARTRVILFAACFAFCAFESSKTLSILAVFVAVLIDVLVPAIRPPRATAARGVPTMVWR